MAEGAASAPSAGPSPVLPPLSLFPSFSHSTPTPESRNGLPVGLTDDARRDEGGRKRAEGGVEPSLFGPHLVA